MCCPCGRAGPGALAHRYAALPPAGCGWRSPRCGWRCCWAIAAPNAANPYSLPALATTGSAASAQVATSAGSAASAGAAGAGRGRAGQGGRARFLRRPVWDRYAPPTSGYVLCARSCAGFGPGTCGSRGAGRVCRPPDVPGAGRGVLPGVLSGARRAAGPAALVAAAGGVLRQAALAVAGRGSGEPALRRGCGIHARHHLRRPAGLREPDLCGAAPPPRPRPRGGGGAAGCGGRLRGVEPCWPTYWRSWAWSLPEIRPPGLPVPGARCSRN